MEPTPIKTEGKESKNPLDIAVNAILESASKASQGKVKEQAEKYLKAQQVANNELEVLKELIESSKDEKAEVKKILSNIA